MTARLATVIVQQRHFPITIGYAAFRCCVSAPVLPILDSAMHRGGEWLQSWLLILLAALRRNRSANTKWLQQSCAATKFRRRILVGVRA
jgi:hypothetical protein